MAVINYITQVPCDFGAVGLARAECELIGPRPGLSRMGGGRETGHDAADAALGDCRHVTQPRAATREDNLRFLETSA